MQRPTAHQGGTKPHRPLSLRMPLCTANGACNCCPRRGASNAVKPFPGGPQAEAAGAGHVLDSWQECGLRRCSCLDTLCCSWQGFWASRWRSRTVVVAAMSSRATGPRFNNRNKTHGIFDVARLGSSLPLACCLRVECHFRHTPAKDAPTPPGPPSPSPALTPDFVDPFARSPSAPVARSSRGN